MSKTVSGRVDEETAQGIEEYADSRGISRSKAVAELAENALELTGDNGPDIAATDDIQQLLDLQQEAQQLAEQVSQKTTAQTQQVERMLADHFELSDVDKNQIKAFADEPYKLLPKGDAEYYVVTPRFVPFSVGHLLEQDDAWNVFVINKYVAWIEDIPTPIQDKIDLKRRYEEAVVEDDMLELSDEEERDRAWDDLGGQDGGLYKRVGDDKIKIKSGKEFDVIAELIESGNLPFSAKPIADDDLRGEPENVALRPYQERAWAEFSEHGQVGVYWPPGLGKTFFGLYAGERLNGKKLVVVPSSTLEEQWEERIKEHTKGRRHRREWEVRTYQYLTTNSNIDDYTGRNTPTLTIFDECHTLPANTFSKLATIDTDYRIGLSATPYREDERTDYIFALTGVPVGIQWEELLEYGDFEYPEVSVYLYRTQRQKRQDLNQLVQESAGKTLVFCDELDAGKKLSSELDVPFVHGETPKSDRLDIIRDNRVTVVSRVGDEGLSLDDLDRVVEYKFHGGSRRQELQRAGRVMHSDGIGQHIVQMTDQEFEKFGQRLYSLEEKGMDIRVERRE